MTVSFKEKELEVIDVIPASNGFPSFEVYDYPVSEREAVLGYYQNKPVWALTGLESEVFAPKMIPDNIARGMVNEADRSFDPNTQGGGNDMFGIEWVYVPKVGGSMEAEGVKLFEDANKWTDIIVWPNIDSWDWEGSAAANNDTFLSSGKFNKLCIFTGWFERLISFMGFEDASVAMIDEDQEDAVKDLFMKLSDLYIDIVEHVARYYKGVDGFFIHDDWGSQAAPFFSPERCAELIVPAMRKVTDKIHELGMYAELHSCGNHGAQMMPNIIAAGWDSWSPQPMNDIVALSKQYAGKIKLFLPLPSFTDENSLQEQTKLAEKFVSENWDNGNAVHLTYGSRKELTPEFRKALYVASRKIYSKSN